VSNYTSINNGSSIKTLDFYNVITIYYAWDYETSQYSKVFTYPESDALNPSFQIYGRKRELSLELPAIYTLAIAEKWAKRYYYLWAFGITYGSQESTLADLGNTEFILDSGTGAMDLFTFKANQKYVTIGDKNRVFMSGYLRKEDVFNVWP
jgi:hypothetical protein